MNNPPLVVAENLHLDVARAVDQALDVEGAVAEGRRGFAPRGLNGVVHLGREVDAAHAFAAAAGRCLDQDRQADAVDGAAQPFVGLILGRLARHDRNAGRRHQPARLDLRAHARDDGRRRSDEHEWRALAGVGQGRVLGEKTVARVQRVGARGPRRGDEIRNRQIAFGGRGRADAHRLVGGRNVWRAAHRRPNRRPPFRRQAPGRRERSGWQSRRDWQSADVGSSGPEFRRVKPDEHKRTRSAVHIRKTPNFGSGIGAFSAIDSPSASAGLVSTGSRMPSSHSRAVE